MELKTLILELEAPGAKDRRFMSDGGYNTMRLDPLTWQYTLACTSVEQY